MPIYEYQCIDCGKKFDALRLMSQADVPIECEKCASLNTARKVTVAYGHSSGRVVAGDGGGSGCGGCSGGSCGSCSP
jgi:putative FmdB family regulatory protein